MAYDIGTARGVIEMEYNGRGIDEAQNDLVGLDAQGKRSSASLAGTGRAAGKAGLIVAGALGAATLAAANFEQRMSGIAAVSGATEGELEALRKKALQLGQDTQFSAGESAQAMEELVKAGLSVDDVLSGAADATVALAAAGEVDMPTAATIASNAMNQFNLAAEDMVGVADNIAGAANASAIDVGEFGESLQQVGAVANLAGVSFKDTATAIALMGNAGIKGSDAGTSLKSMFARLQPVTAKQKSLFQELGIITEDGANKFYDAQGNLKDLASVSQVLQNSLKGMTKQQKQATLQTLFGSDAIRAAAILSDRGAKGFNKMGDAMGKVKAADVAKTRMDNLKGSVEEMMGSLETLAITMGSILLPPLRQVVDALTGLFNWFGSLSSGTQKTIVGILAFVAAALLIVSAVVKIIIVVGKVQAALVALKGTMIATWAAALGPIALVIAAVVAVVAIIILLWKKSETFRDIVLGVWGAIKDAAMAVANWFMNTFVPALVAVWDAISSSAQAVWDFIVGAIKTAVQLIVTVVSTYVKVLLAIWNAVWGLFGPAVKAVFDFILAVIKLVWTIIKGVVLANVNFIRNIIMAAWNFIKAATTRVWNGLKRIFTAVWGFIGPYVKGAVNAIKAVIVSVWNAIKSATSKVWNGLIKPIGEFIGKAMDKVRELKDKVVNFFAGAGKWLLNAGKEIIQGLIDGITDMFGKLQDKVEDVTGWIADHLPGSPVKKGPLRSLNHGHAGKEIIQMVIDGIDVMHAPLGDAMSTALAVPAGYATPSPGTTPIPRRPHRGGDRRGMRLVDGELRLDPSGRAFIRGVATEADDDGDDFDGLISRMGG